MDKVMKTRLMIKLEDYLKLKESYKTKKYKGYLML